MKIDIAKAYDRVEWSFLGKFLLAFSFSKSIIKVIL